MSAKTKTTEVFKVAPTSDPRQFWVANNYSRLEGEWEDIYVNFTGFFGKHGPHVFAAAPELLEALELYALSYSDEELVQLAECTSGMGEISPVTAKREIIRRAATTKAKGETK